MCGFSCKKKERKVLNSSLYSLTHRNARILKLVSLRVRRIRLALFFVFTAQKGNNSKEFLKSGAGVPPSLIHFSLLLITFQKSTRRLVKSE